MGKSDGCLRKLYNEEQTMIKRRLKENTLTTKEFACGTWITLK